MCNTISVPDELNVFFELLSRSDPPEKLEEKDISSALEWIEFHPSWDLANKPITDRMIQYIVVKRGEDAAIARIYRALFCYPPSFYRGDEHEYYHRYNRFLTLENPSEDEVKEFILRSSERFVFRWVENNWSNFSQETQKRYLGYFLKLGKEDQYIRQCMFGFDPLFELFTITSNLSAPSIQELVVLFKKLPSPMVFSFFEEDLTPLARLLFEKFYPGVSEVTPHRLQRIEYLLLTADQMNLLIQLIEGELDILSYLSYRCEKADPNLIAHVKEIISHEEVGDLDLTLNIIFGNKQFFELQLMRIHDKAMQGVYSLLHPLVFVSDIDYWGDRLVQHGLEIDLVNNIDKIEPFFEYNQTSKIRWLIKNIIFLDDSTAKKIRELALSTNNLEIVVLISNFISQKLGLPSVQVPIVLTDDASDSQNMIEIFSWALNTPLTYLEKYLKQNFSHLLSVFDEVKELIPHLVRLPAALRRGINPHFESKDTYVQASLCYAKDNWRFIKIFAKEHQQTAIKHHEMDRKTGKRFKSGLFNQFLEAVVQDRAARFPNLDKHYFMDSVNKFFNTPLIVKESISRELPLTCSRYMHAWHKTLDNLQPDDPLVDIDDGGFVFKYDLNGKLEPMTHVMLNTRLKTENAARILVDNFGDAISKVLWIHTLNPKLFAVEMEAIHCTVLSFPEVTSENLPELKALIARGYYLVATLCHKGRGTPHNAMMWLNMVHYIHGLKLPVPKLETVYLDNEMLAMTYKQAVEGGLDRFFEEPVQMGNHIPK